jgi:NAD(P)-dependent dehydrogenase (short-subunit alcohol dehydrogenase family)
MQGKHGTKDAASYSASKWGILGLMKSAAMLGEHNITVNALIPGLVATALTRYDKRLSETIGETGRPKDDHGLGYPRANSPIEGRLASAGRYLSGSHIPGFRRREHGHRSQLENTARPRHHQRRG